MLNLGKKAFTIVELLIVIVVIGLLALLVLNNVGGATSGARDAQRQTDINAIHSQLEAFHAQNGFYPSTAVVEGWPTNQPAGLSEDALIDPRGNPINAPDVEFGYVYAAAPAGCDNEEVTCTSYTLSTDLESGSTFEKNSLVN